MTSAMAPCCILPLLIIVIFGVGGRVAEIPTWLIIGVIAAIIGIHMLVMKKTCKHSDNSNKANIKNANMKNPTSVL